MAWARPQGAPQFPHTPYEALEPRENYYNSLFEAYSFQILGGVFGVITPAFQNAYLRRPYFAGIWKHITLGIAAAYMGLWLRNLRREQITEKYEIMRHYINLHPEDFPPYKRQLLKDMLQPWTPRR